MLSVLFRSLRSPGCVLLLPFVKQPHVGRLDFLFPKRYRVDHDRIVMHDLKFRNSILRLNRHG